MKRFACILIACATAFPATASAAWEPGPERFGEHVTRDVPITTRDGVVLRADVYRPAGEDGEPAEGRFPVLVSQTPYGKEASGAGLDLVTGHRPYLVKRGYVQAIVDVRGQGASQGSFQLLGPEEMADGREVVRWASRLENTTGEVGLTGVSYLGITQLFTAASVGRNSPLKAIFPVVAPADPYRDLVFHGGLLNIESSLALVAAYGALPIASPLFGTGFNPGSAANLPSLLPDRARDGLQGFATQTLANVLSGGDRAYDGTFWSDSRQPEDALKRIVANRIPAFLVAGAYDVFQRGTPLLYSGLQNASASRSVHRPMTPRQRVTSRYQLLVKPQFHSSIELGEPSLDVLQLAWFDRWLKHRRTGITGTRRPLHVVESDGTSWRTARYPVAEAKPRTFHLGADGQLARAAGSGEGDTLAFTGASLPCDRSTEQWALGAVELAFQPYGFGNPCAGQDLVPASAGPGQIVYTSAPFARDRRLAGPIAAAIDATSTTPDSEWVLKLSDVAPDGTSVDLTQGSLLGSHRALVGRRTWRGPGGRPILPYHPHTKAAKQPVPVGELVRYDVELRPAFVTLRAGHRLRLTVLSSQSPHLLPLPEDLANLAGGVYEVQRSSTLSVPLR